MSECARIAHMEKVTPELLGRRIRDERKLRGQTQEEVARKVNVDRTVLNKIENGTRRVSALELADIASAIEVRMASFFEEPLPAVVSHRSSQGLDTEDSQIDTLLSDCASEVEFVNERSEEHTSELQSRFDLVCRLLLEKK